MELTQIFLAIKIIFVVALFVVFLKAIKQNELAYYLTLLTVVSFVILIFGKAVDLLFKMSDAFKALGS